MKVEQLVEILLTYGHIGALSGLGVVTVFVVFWAIGRWVPGRAWWEAPLLGWAVVYLLSVSSTLVGIRNLLVTLGVSIALAAASLIARRPQLVLRPGVGIYLLMGVPLLAVSMVTPSFWWDSYTHWLLNAAYLFRQNHFPSAPLENFLSMHPTYPGALPLTIYFASHVAGKFAELSGSFINVLLTLSGTGCVAQLLREHLKSAAEPARAEWMSRVVLPAVAFCILLPLNPSVRSLFYWSALPDPVLGIVVLVVITQACRVVAQENRAGSWVSLFLLGVLVAGLKPSTWVLAVVLLTGMGAAAFVHGLSFRRWMHVAAAFLGGVLLASALWAVYLKLHLPIADQFFVRPLTAWRFELLPQLLRSVLKDFDKWPGYYGLVALTALVGLVPVLNRWLIPNKTVRVMVTAASIAMVLHVSSLVVAYLGTGFVEWEIKAAASLQRYSLHVGYSVCVLGLLALALRVLPVAVRFSGGVSTRRLAAAGLAASVALVFVQTIQPALWRTRFFAGALHERALVLEALDAMPPGSRVAIIGSDWSAVFPQYVSWVDRDPERLAVLVAVQKSTARDDQVTAAKVLQHWERDPHIDRILLVNSPVSSRPCLRTGKCLTVRLETPPKDPRGNRA